MCSATVEILCPSSYPNVHYHVHKNTTVYTILRHMNPLHTLPPTPRSLPFRFHTECCTPVHAHTKRRRFKFAQCPGLGLDDQEMGLTEGRDKSYFSPEIPTLAMTTNQPPIEKELGLFPEG